jgi:hypothetical protein
MLNIFRNHYQKQPIANYLVARQYYSCVASTFTPNLQLLYDIIDNNQIISFRSILNNHIISDLIFNKILNRMTQNVDLNMVLMEFFADKILPAELSIDLFVKSVKHVFTRKGPMINILKFTFQNTKHYKIICRCIIALCENDCSLDWSRIQLCLNSLDYTGQDYNVMGKICIHNTQFTHVFYQYVYPAIDRLTYAININKNYPLMCRANLYSLPDNGIYLMDIYKSFVYVLDVTLPNICELIEVILIAHFNKINVKKLGLKRLSLRNKIIQLVFSGKEDYHPYLKYYIFIIFLI